MTNLLDKKQMAEALGISTRTLDRLRAIGQIRGIKLLGGKRALVRFEPAEFDRLISRNKEKV